MSHALRGRATLVVTVWFTTFLKTYSTRTPRFGISSRSKLAVASLVVGCFRPCGSVALPDPAMVMKSGPFGSRLTSPGS